jgi:hypothetical protein
MKQKIYMLGLIANIIVFLGAMFKVNHFPGAGILLTLGISFLVFVFLPIALRNNYKAEGNSQNLILYIITWLTCFVVFIAMLFKIQHWPGAGYALIIALPFPYLVFLPVFLYVTSKNKNFNIYNTVFVLFLLAIISAFSALLALNVSKERIVDSIGISRNYNKVEIALNELPFDFNQSPVNQKIDEILKIVDDYQGLILKNDGLSVTQWENDPEIVLVPGSGQFGLSRLIAGKENSPDTKLEKGLSALIHLMEKTTGCEELAKDAPAIFNLQESSGKMFVWTDRLLMNNTPPWTLIYLDGLETNLKMIKSTMVK